MVMSAPLKLARLCKGTGSNTIIVHWDLTSEESVSVQISVLVCCVRCCMSL